MTLCCTRTSYSLTTLLLSLPEARVLEQLHVPQAESSVSVSEA